MKRYILIGVGIGLLIIAAIAGLAAYDAWGDDTDTLAPTVYPVLRP